MHISTKNVSFFADDVKSNIIKQDEAKIKKLDETVPGTCTK